MIIPSTKLNDNVYDEIAVESIRMELWAKVLARTQEKPPDLASLTLTRLMSYFQAASPEQELIDALQTIHELGHEAGQAAIETAMQKTGYRFPTDNPPQGEYEEALVLWLAKQEGIDQGTLDLAHVLCAVRSKRTYKHLRGKQVKPFYMTDFQKRSFENAIANWCAMANIDGTVDARFREYQGDMIVQIMRGSKTLKIKDRMTSKMVVVVPARCDIIRYSPLTGSLSISATTQLSLLGEYARKFGEIFFQDIEFFSTDDIIDLQPFSNPILFDNMPYFGIDRMLVSTIILDGPEGQAGFRGKGKRDCYAVIRDLGISIADRVIKKVVLKVWFSNAAERRKQELIVLESPYNIRIPDTHNGERFREFLRHHLVLIGRPKPTNDPWFLMSETHPWQTWIDEFEADAENMRKKNLIIQSTPTSLKIGEDDWNQGEVRELPLSANGRMAVLVGNDPEGTTQLIGITDLNSYKLDAIAFANLMRTELKLERVDAFSHQDFTHLGIRRFSGPNKEKSVSIYLSLNPPINTPAIMERLIKGGPKADEIVMLVPTDADPKLFCGAHIIPWKLPGLMISPLMRTIVDRLEWRHEVYPNEYADTNQRIIIMAKKDSCEGMRAWFDGQEKSLEGEDQKALHTLVVADGQIVPYAKLLPAVCSCPENSAAARLKKLRDALGLDKIYGRKVLKNHPKQGYSFNKQEIFVVLI